MFVCCEANPNRIGDSKIAGRNDFLFIIGLIAVIAGLLFPLSVRILDVLLIFSVSLTAAVLIITFSARPALEVSGFPLLIVLATMLRMALSVACSRLILSQGNAGTIIGLFGGIIVGNNVMLSILVFGTLAIAIFGTICKAVKSISCTAAEFTVDIVPVKQISIDSDLNAGVINESQALNLRSKIAHEADFFVAMAGAARFILCAAVIELVIVIVNTVASMGMGIVGGATAGTSVKTYATLAVGAGMMTQISALVAAVASKYLVRKSSVPPAVYSGPAEQESVERIEVVSRVRAPFCKKSQNGNPPKCEIARLRAPNEVTPSQAVELQCGNIVSYAEPAESRCIESELVEITNPAAISTPCLRGDEFTPAKAGVGMTSRCESSGNIEAEKEMIAENLEWFDEQTADDNEKDDSNGCEYNDYYEAIAELIESKSTDVTKTILMAAESAKELPVTIPVNVAMHLAHRNQKCLLIDLDLKRAAISKAFDIDVGDLQTQKRAFGEAPFCERLQNGCPDTSNTVHGEVIATCISNLWVWPASRRAGIGKGDTINIKQVIGSLESRYDRLVIYAPNIKLSTDWEQLAGCIKAAILFGPKSKIESSSISDFRRLLNSYGCEILKPMDVFAEVF